MFAWLQSATPVEWLLLLGGIAHALIRFGAWKAQRETVRRPKRDTDCIKRMEWENGRLADAEQARHFTRNLVTVYTTRELYDRDLREIYRRLKRLEEEGE
jgi:hypothetical protein